VSALGPAIHEPIVSDLPAPNSAPVAPAPAAPQQEAAAPAPAPQAPVPGTTAPAIAPGSLAPTAEDGLADATTSLGDTVGGLSPALGQTVRGTGITATDTIHTLAGGQ
jgi:hypothetical protein